MMDKLKQAYRDGLLGEFIRYTLVGLASFAVDYGVLLVLNLLLGVNYLVAAVAGFLLGTACNYVGSIKFAFKNRRVKDRRVERITFLGIGLLGLGLNELLLFLLVGQLAVPVLFSKPLTQLVVFVWNFLARKLILFANRRQQSAAGEAN